MSTNARLEVLRQCEPKRVSTYGSFPWAIVHRPTGAIVEGPRETLDYGLGPRSVMGPSYFTRKKDAKAALDALRAKAANQAPREPSRYERETMGVHEPVRNEELGL